MKKFLKHIEEQYVTLEDDLIKLVLDKMTEPIEMTCNLPAYLFVIVKKDTEEIVGECDFRIGTNESVNYAGQIGYIIYNQYRGHQYAYHALMLLLELGRRHQYPKIIVTSNPENIASIKTIIKAEGKFIKVIDVPKDHGLYKHGEYKMSVYEFRL
ncbi:MAG: GNAT family N-acetyltransferase [Acholeplasmataceae bacterium]|nr:GNAT family N-acetyltransferase [Acholeplasmataceae bacterium]